MIKFFVSPEAVSGSNIYIEKKEDIKHLTKVLRAKCGDGVCISDGGEWEYETEIAAIDENCVTLRILDKQKPAREPRTRVTLYQGIPKASKMEIIIQKNVEIGVDRIVPVFMERTIVTDKGQFGKKLQRWQKIADEAVKQCKRSKIPQIEAPISFGEMLREIGGVEPAQDKSCAADKKQEEKPEKKAKVKYDLVICPYENEENRTMKDCLRGQTSEDSQTSQTAQTPASPKQVAVIIGPEGGFSDKEIALLGQCGASVQLVTLGKTILRTETAGLAALAMIMYELEL